MSDSINNINWYPGHMSKAKRQMTEELKLVDIIIELVDARIPYSSKNPDINRMAEGKPRILLLNKADLADDNRSREFKEYYEKQGYRVILMNSKERAKMQVVMKEVLKACEKKRERDAKKGMVARPLRAMIVGIPNVGKSTFINAFVGKNVAAVGNKPGVTKGKQWIRINKDLELLDTPGILWPKFEDKRVGRNIAFIGSINGDILDNTELTKLLLAALLRDYPGILGKRYSVSEAATAEDMLAVIAQKRACMKKGGELDLDRAALQIIDDFRSGKLGKITLERPTKEDVLNAIKSRENENVPNNPAEDEKDTQANLPTEE